MKTTIRGTILTVTCFLFASTIHTFAIEGLQLSIQCSNVVLRWPSIDTETYIVQYRPTLDPGTPWQTLTSYLPADVGTNVTYFVHSNIVQHPNCSVGGAFSSFSSAIASPASRKQTASSASYLGYLLSQGIPLAKPIDSSGDTVPASLYPPGFDFSNFLIFDPSLEDWISGSGYVVNSLTLDSDWPWPENDSAGVDNGTNSPADIGFYQVVRTGVHLWKITNDMVLSGIVSIPVEAWAESGTLTTISVTENGSSIGSSQAVGPFQNPLYVVLDTTAMNNGVHDIAALARWEISTGTNDGDGGHYEADCPPISIVVSNEISFPGWMPNFGELDNTLLISVQSAHTNTDWTIDIYGANAGYIGTFTGHTFDGSIWGYWDLVGPPPDFIQYTNEPWFEFKVSTPYADPPIKTYKQADPWPSPGGWVAAAQHAFDSFLGHDDLYEEIDGYVGMAQGNGLTVRPTPISGSAFAIHFNEPSTPSEWTQFRQALFHPLSRNLIYFGHGGPNGLGFNQGDTNASIRASEIANRLHTIPNGQTNRHCYRMVILDGCSTASGTLPESFGIRHQENVPSIDYANASMRRSSFCGWSADKWVGLLNGAAINYGHVHFITWIQYYLAQGNTIKAAKDLAAGMADVTFVDTGEFKIFGCWDTTFFGQNN